MSRASRSSAALASAQPAKTAAAAIRLITAPAPDAAAPAATDRKRKRGAQSEAVDAHDASSDPAVVAASKPTKARASRKKVIAAQSAEESAMSDASDLAAGAGAASTKSAAATSTSLKHPKSSPKKGAGNGKAAAAIVESSDGFKFGTLSRDFERALTSEGKGTHFVGVDEAGRGPLAGPVVCAAVWAPLDRVDIKGVHDSKKMSESERERVYADLTSHPSVVWATAILEHDEIDRINILEATMRGMERAVAGLIAKMEAARGEADAATKETKKKHTAAGAAAPAVSFPAALDLVLVDGNRIPPGLGASAPAPLCIPSMCVIKGDSLCYSIAAASVIAKVTRDRIMMQHHHTWPHYNFQQHKGYGVGAHMSAIYKHGPCPIHRMTFAPMKHMKLKTATAVTDKDDDAAAEDTTEAQDESQEAQPTKKRRASVTKKAATVTKSTTKASTKKRGRAV